MFEFVVGAKIMKLTAAADEAVKKWEGERAPTGI